MTSYYGMNNEFDPAERYAASQGGLTPEQQSIISGAPAGMAPQALAASYAGNVNASQEMQKYIAKELMFQGFRLHQGSWLPPASYAGSEEDFLAGIERIRERFIGEHPEFNPDTLRDDASALRTLINVYSPSEAVQAQQNMQRAGDIAGTEDMPIPLYDRGNLRSDIQAQRGPEGAPDFLDTVATNLKRQPALTVRDFLEPGIKEGSIVDKIRDAVIKGVDYAYDKEPFYGPLHGAARAPGLITGALSEIGKTPIPYDAEGNTEPLKELLGLGVNSPITLNPVRGKETLHTGVNMLVPENPIQGLLELVPGLGTIPGVKSALDELMRNPKTARELLQLVTRLTPSPEAGAAFSNFPLPSNWSDETKAAFEGFDKLPKSAAIPDETVLVKVRDNTGKEITLAGEVVRMMPDNTVMVEVPGVGRVKIAPNGVKTAPDLGASASEINQDIINAIQAPKSGVSEADINLLNRMQWSAYRKGNTRLKGAQQKGLRALVERYFTDDEPIPTIGGQTQKQKLLEWIDEGTETRLDMVLNMVHTKLGQLSGRWSGAGIVPEGVDPVAFERAFMAGGRGTYDEMIGRVKAGEFKGPEPEPANLDQLWGDLENAVRMQDGEEITYLSGQLEDAGVSEEAITRAINRAYGSNKGPEVMEPTTPKTEEQEVAEFVDKRLSEINPQDRNDIQWARAEQLRVLLAGRGYDIQPMSLDEWRASNANANEFVKRIGDAMDKGPQAKPAPLEGEVLPPAAKPDDTEIASQIQRMVDAQNMGDDRMRDLIMEDLIEKGVPEATLADALDLGPKDPTYGLGSQLPAGGTPQLPEAPAPQAPRGRGRPKGTGGANSRATYDYSINSSRNPKKTPTVTPEGEVLPRGTKLPTPKQKAVDSFRDATYRMIDDLEKLGATTPETDAALLKATEAMDTFKYTAEQRNKWIEETAAKWEEDNPGRMIGRRQRPEVVDAPAQIEEPLTTDEIVQHIKDHTPPPRTPQEIRTAVLDTELTAGITPIFNETGDGLNWMAMAQDIIARHPELHGENKVPNVISASLQKKFKNGELTLDETGTRIVKKVATPLEHKAAVQHATTVLSNGGVTINTPTEARVPASKSEAPATPAPQQRVRQNPNVVTEAQIEDILEKNPYVFDSAETLKELIESGNVKIVRLPTGENNFLIYEKPIDVPQEIVKSFQEAAAQAPTERIAEELGNAETSRRLANSIRNRDPDLAAKLDQGSDEVFLEAYKREVADRIESEALARERVTEGNRAFIEHINNRRARPEPTPEEVEAAFIEREQARRANAPKVETRLDLDSWRKQREEAFKAKKGPPPPPRGSYQEKLQFEADRNRLAQHSSRYSPVSKESLVKNADARAKAALSAKRPDISPDVRRTANRTRGELSDDELKAMEERALEESARGPGRRPPGGDFPDGTGGSGYGGPPSGVGGGGGRRGGYNAYMFGNPGRRPIPPHQWQKELLALPRETLATLDFSAILRQGWVQSLSHPLIAGKNAATAAKVFVDVLRRDGDFAQQVMDGIGVKYRNLKTGGTSKLYFGKLEEGLSENEETFVRSIIEDIPGLGRLPKASRYAYQIYLAKLRDDVFNSYMDLWTKGEVLPGIKAPKYLTREQPVQTPPWMQGPTKSLLTPDDPQVKALIDWINVSTGRGSFGANTPFFGEKNVGDMAQLLFAPRLLASRIQTPATFIRALVPWSTLPARVRFAVAKDTIQAIATVGTMVWLAEKAGMGSVEIDPTSSDFGKIKIGHTRIDPWGGYQQLARLVSQLATMQRKAVSGEKYAMDPHDAGNAIIQFLGNKFAPVPSGVLDFGAAVLGADKTLTGAPPPNLDLTGPFKDTIWNEMLSRTAPLFLQDLYAAIKEHGVLKGSLLAAPAFLGISSSTFASGAEMLDDDIAKAAKEGITYTSPTTGQQLNHWWELDPADKRDLKAKFPGIEKTLNSLPTSEKGLVAEGREEDIKKASAAFISSGDAKAYQTNINKIREDYALQFAKFSNDERVQINKPEWIAKLDNYFNEIQKAGTTYTDPYLAADMRDATEARLRAQMNPEERAKLDQILQGSTDPIYEQYKKSRDIINKNYWAIRDLEYSKLRKEASGEIKAILDKHPNLSSLTQAANSRNTGDEWQRNKVILDKVQGILTERMNGLMASRPDFYAVTDALRFIWGYSDTIHSAQAQALVSSMAKQMGFDKYPVAPPPKR